MAWGKEDIIRRLGLSSKARRDASVPAVLTGAATDPDTGLIVSVASTTQFDNKNNPRDIAIDYWRHLPYGSSQKQSLIRMSLQPAEIPGTLEPEQIWIQSRLIYDRARGDDLNDPETKKNVSRVIGAVSKLNTHLRENGPIEDLAKILIKESLLGQVAGENLMIRGLKTEGGFDIQYMPAIFMNASAKGLLSKKGKKAPLEFRDIDLTTLKTVLGFRINTLEPDRSHDGDRLTSATDAQSGVGYQSGVRIKESAKKLEMEIYVQPEDIPAGLDPKAIPNLLKFSFSKKGSNAYVLDEAMFLGQKVDETDSAAILKMIGMAQAANRDFAREKYPAFIDSTAQFDMLDMVNPLTPPPSLEEKGGELLYVSLHGCGNEKKVENFGDQIGTAALFLQRGTRADGSISTVGVAVDFPFASGGADSNYDGAIPDYLPFWQHINAFAITHDHYDHKGGLFYYAMKGLLRGKTIYCTPRVKYFIDADLKTIPRENRPVIKTLEKEGALPLDDDQGNTRMWLQYSPDAIMHSSLCTPYIITGCYGDHHYNGSALVYGDSRGIEDANISFFQQGTRALPAYAAAYSKTVTPAKVDRDISIAFHDITAVRYDGPSPEPQKIEDHVTEILSWFPDMTALVSPISTNHPEYVASINAAHKTGRNITAVGRNAELRVSSLNMFGVNPHLDLRKIRIDPLEEKNKPEAERLIPDDILEDYIQTLEFSQNITAELNLNTDKNLWTDEEKKKYDRALKKVHNERLDLFLEKLPPEQREHENSARVYIREKLMEHGAVIFEDDLNGYLMWKAITDKQSIASLRATRGTILGKSFREDPGSLMVFVTGTQGNAEEKASTMGKFQDGISLLDADETVRSTGYKLDPEKAFWLNMQSAIVGNDDAQARMIQKTIAARDITVISAFMNGFTVHNPKDKRDHILKRLKTLGWTHETDGEGNIRVYGRPIHVHGHGFKQDLLKIAKTIKADINAAHHIPDRDSCALFADLMQKNGLNSSAVTPDDFKVCRINAAEKLIANKFTCVANLNPSYILVRMVRKYGQFFGGYLEWARTTMLRREGSYRADGLHAGSSSDGIYSKKTARSSWEGISNNNKRDNDRSRRLGPGMGDRRPGEGGPRSLPMLNGGNQSAAGGPA